MMQLYELLKNNIKSGVLKPINYLVPQITTMVTSSNIIISELTKYKLYNWDETKYNKKRIDKLSTNEFDLYTIAWLPGQFTSIHDHPIFGCILCLLTGTIEEKIYDKKLNLIKTITIKAPYVGYIDNKIGYHSIKCIDKAVTLHIYSPPNHKPFLMSA
jgi:hypothetical protein